MATDDAAAVVEATAELLSAVVADNGLRADEIVFILFTATQDLHSAFPAAAVTGAGLSEVPRLCATEMDVAGAMPRVVRLVLFAEAEQPRSDVRHVYLGGAVALRPGTTAPA